MVAGDVFGLGEVGDGRGHVYREAAGRVEGGGLGIGGERVSPREILE